MKKERTLSFAAGREITPRELQRISAAASHTLESTAQHTYLPTGGSDVYIDVRND